MSGIKGNQIVVSFVELSLEQPVERALAETENGTIVEVPTSPEEGMVPRLEPKRGVNLETYLKVILAVLLLVITILSVRKVVQFFLREKITGKRNITSSSIDRSIRLIKHTLRWDWIEISKILLFVISLFLIIGLSLYMWFELERDVFVYGYVPLAGFILFVIILVFLYISSLGYGSS